VELDEFLACPFNMAFNRYAPKVQLPTEIQDFRQTRMLADLTLVRCYDASSMEPGKRDKIMLESAKSNLRSMAFFGIKERMKESQVMFEKLFNLRFEDRSDSHGKLLTT